MTVNTKERKALNTISATTDDIDFLVWDIQAINEALHELLVDLEEGIKDLEAYGLSGGLPGRPGIVSRAWVLSAYCDATVKKLEHKQQIVSDNVAGLHIATAGKAK